MCQEVGGSTNWVEVRGAVNDALREIATGLLGPEPINPDTWGLEPEHIEAQDRILRRGGNVGDR